VFTVKTYDRAGPGVHHLQAPVGRKRFVQDMGQAFLLPARVLVLGANFPSHRWPPQSRDPGEILKARLEAREGFSGASRRSKSSFRTSATVPRQEETIEFVQERLPDDDETQAGAIHLVGRATNRIGADGAQKVRVVHHRLRGVEDDGSAAPMRLRYDFRQISEDRPSMLEVVLTTTTAFSRSAGWKSSEPSDKRGSTSRSSLIVWRSLRGKKDGVVFDVGGNDSPVPAFGQLLQKQINPAVVFRQNAAV